MMCPGRLSMDIPLILLLYLLIRIHTLLCSGFTTAHNRPNHQLMASPRIITLVYQNLHTLYMCYSPQIFSLTVETKELS